MAKKTLEELKSQFQKTDTDNRPSNYYRFWDMKYGESATIRFLPDKNEDNPLGFMVEKLMHTLEINGDRRTVPCLKMYEHDCPICRVSSGFYKEEGKGSVNGKNYWRKKQHIVQALIVEDPLPINSETGENSEGKVCYLNLSYQLYNVIKMALTGADLDAIPYDYEEGFDFVIKKTQLGENAKYDVGSNFARRSTALTAEQIEFVEEELIDLSTLIPQMPDEDKIDAMLNAALTGDYYDDGSGEASQASTPAPASTVNESVTKTTTTVSAVVDDDPVAVTGTTAEYAEKGEDIMANIRARKKTNAV